MRSSIAWKGERAPGFRDVSVDYEDEMAECKCSLLSLTFRGGLDHMREGL